MHYCPVLWRLAAVMKMGRRARHDQAHEVAAAHNRRGTARH